MQPALLFVQFDDRRTESSLSEGRAKRTLSDFRSDVICVSADDFHSESEASSFRKILDPKFRFRAFAALGERAFPLA